MLKRALFSIGLAAALIAFAGPAGAQNYKGTPKPAISNYGPFANFDFRNSSTKPSTGKCGNPEEHCLFYGGDFNYNPLGADVANGLANEDTNEVGGTPYGAATWVPFTVPEGQTWNVTGLFTNNQASYGVLDQGTEPLSVAYWSINEGLFAGNAGTVIDSGTNVATSTKTGRSAFGLEEYTIQVTGLSVTLTAGTYWLAVVPICTNTADPYCDGAFFLSDVEYINTTPSNAFGPAEPIDSSFFDSPYFGYSFSPPNGEAGACFGIGCDAFSAGVLGTESK